MREKKFANQQLTTEPDTFHEILTVLRDAWSIILSLFGEYHRVKQGSDNSAA